MNLKKITSRGLSRIGINPYRLIDRLFIPYDRERIKRTRNIRLIPFEQKRTGGKNSYAEWAHVIGIFQTLICRHLQQKEGNVILDVGCGTGLLAIASEPFIGKGGKYIGIDVRKADIDFCRSHYPSADFEFIHLDASNAMYAPTQNKTRLNWPIENECIDLVTALSVWTHLNEEDALFYFNEASRALKPGGKAIITFFLLDELYEKSLGARSDQEGRYHLTQQDKWVFSQASYGSDAWLHPKWAEVPEYAIGVTSAGLERLISNAGLRLIENHHGNWKEIPAVFFQDILIFEKPLRVE